LEGITMHPFRNPSRRDFCRLTAVAVVTLSHRDFFVAAQQPAATEPKPKVLTPDASLRELLAGNQRFVKGQIVNPRRSPADFSPLANAQYPEAVVITCSDSRVSPEILFDAGVGDLFVVRVAGNVVDGAGVTVPSTAWSNSSSPLSPKARASPVTRWKTPSFKMSKMESHASKVWNRSSPLA
jgi:carbonic anhydrase